MLFGYKCACVSSYFADVKDLNYLEGVLHDNLAHTLKEAITGHGKLTANDFDNLLPKLTARLGKLLVPKLCPKWWAFRLLRVFQCSHYKR